jgi:hypothetical protein
MACFPVQGNEARYAPSGTIIMEQDYEKQTDVINQLKQLN